VVLKGHKMTIKKGIQMTLAGRLKYVREDLNKSQKEIAAQIGISFRSWQDYELGKNVPGSAVITELIKLGYNSNWILSGEGPIKTNPLNFLFDSIIDKRKEMRIKRRVITLLNEHKKNNPSVSDDMAFDMYAMLSSIFYLTDDALVTDENINLVIKSFVSIYNVLNIFRKLNLHEESISSIISFFQDPRKWENDTKNILFDAFVKHHDDGNEKSKDGSKKDK